MSKNAIVPVIDRTDDANARLRVGESSLHIAYARALQFAQYILKQQKVNLFECTETEKCGLLAVAFENPTQCRTTSPKSEFA